MLEASYSLLIAQAKTDLEPNGLYQILIDALKGIKRKPIPCSTVYILKRPGAGAPGWLSW